jgi:hypothetical protein
VPYFGSPSDRVVLVNDAARDAIRAAGATSFIALPEADEPNLVALKQAMNEGWQKCEPLGSGSASLWPELFEAGAALIRATVCADASWPADAVEILPGTGWLASASAADENTGNTSSNSRKMRASEDQNIDWVIRRPEGHVVSSKTHFATRMHRDPDSWTNPKTPQRPKDGWTELSMPDRGKYAYRFINVWVARSAIDPTGQVWGSPLVVCLPREGGRREWAFEKRTLAMDDAEAEKEFAVRGIDPIDPKTWIPGINRLFRPLWNGGSGGQDESTKRETPVSETEGADDSKSSSPFEFPELTPSEKHVFVAGAGFGVRLVRPLARRGELVRRRRRQEDAAHHRHEGEATLPPRALFRGDALPREDRRRKGDCRPRRKQTARLAVGAVRGGGGERQVQTRRAQGQRGAVRPGEGRQKRVTASRLRGFADSRNVCRLLKRVPATDTALT